MLQVGASVVLLQDNFILQGPGHCWHLHCPGHNQSNISPTSGSTCSRLKNNKELEWEKRITLNQICMAAVKLFGVCKIINSNSSFN